MEHVPVVEEPQEIPNPFPEGPGPEGFHRALWKPRVRMAAWLQPPQAGRSSKVEVISLAVSMAVNKHLPAAQPRALPPSHACWPSSARGKSLLFSIWYGVLSCLSCRSARSLPQIQHQALGNLIENGKNGCFSSNQSKPVFFSDSGDVGSSRESSAC